MQLGYKITDSVMTVSLSGNFIRYDSDTVQEKMLAVLEENSPKRLKFDSGGLGRWDSTLVVVLFSLINSARTHNIPVDKASLPENLRSLLDLSFSVRRNPVTSRKEKLPPVERLGEWGCVSWQGITRGLHFIGLSLKSLFRLFAGRAVMRGVDFLFALEDCSYKAVGIVSLVSFMVGLILAFVGAIQLRIFGVEIYVSSLVTIAMTRIMGAIMAGIIMAGRTGASYAATIGSMQVNEEIDALKTMGIPVGDFLVLPRIGSLIITMPLLTMLSDFMGMLGGSLVGVVMLGIPLSEYMQYSLNSFHLGNFLIGIFHGFIYGFVISVCGCYYGVYCGRDADSVGVATTKAVVSSIVWMIVVTGFLTIIFEGMEL